MMLIVTSLPSMTNPVMGLFDNYAHISPCSLFFLLLKPKGNVWCRKMG
jgi:hypothetical protein